MYLRLKCGLNTVKMNEDKMEKIIYELYQGTDDAGNEIYLHAELEYNEKNEEIAQKESRNGEYEIVEVGQ